MKCIFQKKPPSSLNYALSMTLWPAISRDLRNSWSILDPVSSCQEMLVWLPSSYGSESTALITKLTRNGLPLENRWFLKWPKWPKPKWGLSCGESLTTAMHGYAMLGSSSSPWVDWIPSKSPWRHDVFSPKSRCSLESDFRLSRYSDIGLEFLVAESKNHPCSTTQRGGQTKAEDQPQWLTKDEAPTIPNSVLIIEFTTCKVEAPNSIECVATSTMNDVNRTRQPMHRTATHGRDLQLNSITDVLSQSYDSKHV